MASGREIIQAWVQREEEPWDCVPSGTDHYRLRFGGSNVLYLRDCADYVSAYVERVFPSDKAFLETLGKKSTDDGRGIRLAVPPSKLPALLEWCRSRLTGVQPLQSGTPEHGAADTSNDTARSESQAYAAVAADVYGCACKACPAFSRLDLPGYYPKFGAGGRAHPSLAMVTMNPGAPDQRQQSLRRRDLSRIEMHSDYERGLLEYHRQPRGGGIGDLFEFVRGITGLTQSEIYYTELAKCVSKGLQPSDERRILRTCSEEHFTRELEAFSGSLKYVICFGRAAFRMTVRAISSSPGLRQLGDRGRLGYVRHPSPLAGSAVDFRRALEETLGEATRECRFPGTGEPTSSPAS